MLRCLFLIFYLGVVIALRSQGTFTPVFNDFTTRVTPSSPVAAGFQKYGDIPVDITSGSQQVTIPITTLQVGNFSWPLSLSYHTNGVRVSEVATDVGLGWVLNGMGMISQKTVGPDDLIEGNMFDTLAAYLQLGGYGGPTGCHYTLPDAEIANEFAAGTANGLPDLFYLNDPLRSLKFFIKNNDSGYCLPASPVRIKFNREVSATNSNWIMTDENGNQYEYKLWGTNSTSTSCTNSSHNWAPTGKMFYLTKITTNQQQTIEFIYSTENYSFSNPKEEVAYVANYTGCTLCALNAPLDYTCTSTSTEHAKKLDSIKCSTGEYIAFKYSSRLDITDGNKLDTLIQGFVYPTASQQMMKWKLSYGYFNSSASDQDSLRLKLTSVKTLNPYDSISEVYRLEYDTINLPSRLSFAVDSFGFYNGIIANTSFLTNVGDRSVDEEFVTAGTLKKITYPTGGYTQFEYEANHVWGGCQIKKVVDVDSVTEKSTIRAYRYVDSHSYSINFTDMLTTHVTTTNSAQNTEGCVTPEFQICRYPDGFLTGYACPYYRYKSTPTDKPVYATYSLFSRYDSVFEKLGENGENGYNEYILGFPKNAPANSYTGVNPQILRKNIYRYNGGASYTLVQSVVDSFSILPAPLSYFDNPTDPRSKYTYGAIVEIDKPEITSPCNEDGSVIECTPMTYLANYIYLFSTPMFRDMEVALSYPSANGPDDSLSIVKKYTYSDKLHLKPISINTTNSRGDDLTQYITYAIDVTTGGAHLPVFDSLVAHNRLGEVVSDSIVKAPSDQLSRSKIFYGLWPNNIIMPDSAQQSTGGNPLTTEVTYNAYDDEGYLISFSKRNNNPVSTIRNYNNLYYTAQVINADSTDIAYTSFEADGKGHWTYSGLCYTDGSAPTGRKVYKLTDSTSLSKSGLSGSKTYILSYWTKNGSAFSVTGTVAGYPVSVRTLNGWTCFEHKITGRTTITLSGTGAIDEVRLHPFNARMTTYTYDPFVGITAQSDPGNRISKYQYDDFRRLILIRDQDNNILKKICYNYAGQTENCTLFYNTVQIGSYTKNDCGIGYVGNAVSDTIFANTYASSSSVAAANAKALADLAANGQDYANANGECTLGAESVDFTMGSGYGSSYNGSTVSDGTVDMDLVFYPTSGDMLSGETYNVATVSSNGRPSGFANKIFYSSSGGRTFLVIIHHSGQVDVQIFSGSDLSTFEAVNLTGSYNL